MTTNTTHLCLALATTCLVGGACIAEDLGSAQDAELNITDMEAEPGPDAAPHGEPDPQSRVIGSAPGMVLYDGLQSGSQLALHRSSIDLSEKRWPYGGTPFRDVASVHLPAGKEATICNGKYYRGYCRTLWSNEPGEYSDLRNYNLSNTGESIEFRPRGGVDWSSYDYQGNHPHHRKGALSRRIQGVAHSARHWFISNEKMVVRIPVESDISLDDNPRLHLRDIPGGCDHIGDIDFYSGELFIPLEGCDGSNFNGDDRIAVYHVNRFGDFTFDRQLILGNQDHAPWVAINPINGHMYSSDYDDPGNTQVHVYNRNFVDGAFSRGQLYRVLLPRHFSGVQGGTFDDKGNLYLTEFIRKKNAGAGIHAYRIFGGVAETIDYIDPNGFKPWPNRGGEEVEGIDWWDLSKENFDIPGIQTGPGAAQLHWLLLRVKAIPSNDYYWFKHVRLN